MRIPGQKKSPFPCFLSSLYSPTYFLPSYMFKKKYYSPKKNTKPFHFIIQPLTIVLSLIGPYVDSLTFYIIITKLSFIGGAVLPDEFPVALFESLFIIPRILSSIWPCLNPIPMLLVFLPITYIICGIYVNIFPLNNSFFNKYISISLIVQPVSFIAVTI